MHICPTQKTVNSQSFGSRSIYNEKYTNVSDKSIVPNTSRLHPNAQDEISLYFVKLTKEIIFPMMFKRKGKLRKGSKVYVVKDLWVTKSIQPSKLLFCSLNWSFVYLISLRQKLIQFQQRQTLKSARWKQKSSRNKTLLSLRIRMQVMIDIKSKTFWQ